MTVVRVLSEPGRLSESVRSELAEALTKVVLDVEVGSDNPVARSGVMVLFDEKSRHQWAVGGRFDDQHVATGGRLLVTAQVMEGVWSASRRQELIVGFCEAIRDALQLGADNSALGSCWVLFSQIEEGGWGAYGAPLSLLTVLEPAQFAEDRAAFARDLLSER